MSKKVLIDMFFLLKQMFKYLFRAVTNSYVQPHHRSDMIGRMSESDPHNTFTYEL